jgi:hypothetical protein
MTNKAKLILAVVCVVLGFLVASAWHAIRTKIKAKKEAKV